LRLHKRTVPDVLDSPSAREQKAARRCRSSPGDAQMFRLGVADVVATMVLLLYG
jgi:hypothetical protein